MTTLDDRPALEAVPDLELAEPAEGPQVDPTAVDDRPALRDLLRPALAAGLVSAAAGFETGGIFGSWPARLLGVAAALLGAAAAVMTQRSRRSSFLLGAFPIIAFVVACASLIGTSAGPGGVVDAVRDAIKAGNLLRPPVPFDPGWRVVLIMTLAPLAFAAAWIGTALGKPRAAIAIPLPAIALTAITQPDDAKLLAGAVPFVLLLAALAVLFGGDVRSARDLGRRFELRRAVKALVAMVPLVAVVIAFNSASFLFPKPVYTPTQAPQKPRLVSGSADVVLFEVKTTSAFTGPWRTGVLDSYDDNAWKLPPRDEKRLVKVTTGGSLPEVAIRAGLKDVTIIVHDLGDTPILPTLAGTTSLDLNAGNVLFDTRTQVPRVSSGRVPHNLTYTMRVPPYANDGELRAAAPASGPDVNEQLKVPAVPPYVETLLAQAPTSSAFARMNYLRRQLLDNVTAKGVGVPVDITPARVDDLLHGSKLGTPYEIVAAEAMLARWAGVPSRIGFGFDGLNKETTGVISVRPRNAAQWLEVDFDGFGWLPLVSAPKKAQTSLDNDQNTRKDKVLASDDVAVQVYIPYKIVDAKQLYQIVRYYLSIWSPVALALALAYLCWPVLAKLRRRAKRRHWAAALGPQAQIAVEYAELRDLATDLNIGDLYSTPLEYLFTVRPDDEHTDFAWLVARTLYGDLAESAGPDEVQAAEELAASVRRRLYRAQPVQSRLFARLSRASLLTPYEPGMPNVRVHRLPTIRHVAALALRAVWHGLRSLSRMTPRPRRRATA